MNGETIYSPRYENSRALVIGINDYQLASPLGYARQDAEAYAEALVSKFGFPDANVKTLFDGDATREAIMSTFLSFTQDSVLPDDRLAIFFAGHGCTRNGARGEVGFLVPVDGCLDNLATLIRWDELTRNADLIPAKHLLFIMDACYGGLAISRSLRPGNARFLKDMLQRYSRQVLTAGKANEMVADSGGPRPGHSMFTGHLLDALDGKAADGNGIISANAVMAYVYDRVSKDPYSQQSPHFGFFSGDGDFIFAAPELNKQADGQVGSDVLVQVPIGTLVNRESDTQSLLEQTKDFLSDSRYRVRLDDLVASEVRATSSRLHSDEFPVATAEVTFEQVAQRLRKYEAVLERLKGMLILICRWGATEHQALIERIIARLSDGLNSRSGTGAWLALRWYPTMTLMYSGGIAALSSHNYRTLATLLLTKVKNSSKDKTQAVVLPTVEEILGADRMELFKRIPGHEKYHVPRSEYLFKSLQPQLEDILFLGNGYEDLFDQFEVFYALTYADLSDRGLDHIWGPPGRFGYKGHYSEGPFESLVAEALQQNSTWPPLACGLFRGSIDRFTEVAKAYREQILHQLHWF